MHPTVGSSVFEKKIVRRNCVNIAGYVVMDTTRYTEGYNVQLYFVHAADNYVERDKHIT